MRLSHLHPLFLTVALAQVHAVSEAPQAGGGAKSAVIENQRLFISDGFQYASSGLDFVKQLPMPVPRFFSLDLTTAWTSNAPAWTALPHRSTAKGESQGIMIPTKDNDSLLFFSGNTTYQFNIKSNEWAKDPFMTWTYPAFDKAVVTDTDTGLIYGMEREPIGPPASIKLRFTEFDPITKKYTSTELQDQDPITRRTLLYSKLSKAIYSYMEIGQGEKRLFSYNIASKTWFVVNATGDIPSYRVEPCFVSAYGGKKLILAGGKDTDLRSDTYSFDVATSIWTRLADAPRATWGHTCAASEDSFIIWGGYGVDKDDKEIFTNNGDGPVILNMATNTWDNKYTPSGQTPKSSANHAHMVSKVESIALMVASFAASSLFF